MRLLKYFGIALLLLIGVYFVGPKPSKPTLSAELPSVPGSISELGGFIESRESPHQVKPGNEARIIWYDDSLKGKTPYSLVYLHGFSASREEGHPVHINVARKLGCNLFLSRLAEHGLRTNEAMADLTADKLWRDAKEAYAIGKQIGHKVILMGTSTGGSLALKLAAVYPEIAALILLSPNIAINDKNAWLLNNPWGLQIARMVKGGNYHYSSDSSEDYKKYWYHKYRLESLVQLEEFLETTMKESTFRNITQPVLLLYYYKNEDEQDKIVKVSAMKRMFAQLGTMENRKREVAIPNAGDHVIGSYIKSKDVETVELEILRFAEEVLLLNKTVDSTAGSK